MKRHTDHFHSGLNPAPTQLFLASRGGWVGGGDPGFVSTSSFHETSSSYFRGSVIASQHSTPDNNPQPILNPACTISLDLVGAPIRSFPPHVDPSVTSVLTKSDNRPHVQRTVAHLRRLRHFLSACFSINNSKTHQPNWRRHSVLWVVPPVVCLETILLTLCG